MFCEKCGAKMGDNDVFCAECGNKVNQITENVQEVYEAEAPVQQPIAQEVPNMVYTAPVAAAAETKSNRGLIITICACAAVLLTLVITLIVVFVGGKDDGTTIYEPAPPVSDDVDDEKESQKDVEVQKIDASVISDYIDSGVTYTNFGIYVKNLKTGMEFGYNDSDVFLSSAMGQVVILDTLSRAFEQKNLDADSEGLYFSYLENNGKAAPDSKADDGRYVSIRECIEDVAMYGDNNKSNQLVDYIADIYGKYNGFDVINNNLRNNGYKNTQINRKTYVNSDLIDYTASPNVTTAREINDMFYNLIYDSSFGNSAYMKNIFKSISNDGASIGFKKLISANYEVYNVNALNSQCTNNVAVISDGDCELVVTILSETPEGRTSIENNDTREAVIRKIINYIINIQFED